MTKRHKKQRAPTLTRCLNRSRKTGRTLDIAPQVFRHGHHKGAQVHGMAHTKQRHTYLPYTFAAIDGTSVYSSRPSVGGNSVTWALGIQRGAPGWKSRPKRLVPPHQLRGLGSAVSSLAGSGAEPQPKSNFGTF